MMKRYSGSTYVTRQLAVHALDKKKALVVTHVTHMTNRFVGTCMYKIIAY